MGEVVGSYRILERIGEGAVGVVYLAEHVLIGRKAAVKMLHATMAGNHDVVHRFFNEARAVAMLRHPGLVDVYDFGFVDDRAFLIMEYLEGRSLRAAVKALGRFPLGRALAMIRQIAGAVGAAHKQGIVHRDLKPDNVMLVPDTERAGKERAKVVDFGVAKLTNFNTSSAITRLGTVMGTPLYMAPEQCRGLVVDHRADIYSLGCIAFELLTGHLPFDESTVADVLASHIKRPPPRLRQFEPKIPKSIELVVLSMLAKEPDERPQTMDGVVTALEDADEGWLAAELGHGSRPSLTDSTLTGLEEHPSANDLTVVAVREANDKGGAPAYVAPIEDDTRPRGRVEPLLAKDPRSGGVQARGPAAGAAQPPLKAEPQRLPPTQVDRAPPQPGGPPRSAMGSSPAGRPSLERQAQAAPPALAAGSAARPPQMAPPPVSDGASTITKSRTIYVTLQTMMTRRIILALGLGLGVIVLAVVLLARSGGEDDGTKTTFLADQAARHQDLGGPIAVTPQVDAAVALFMVRIESQPEPADVYRASDGKFLGATPYNDRVPEAQRGQFYIVRLRGYKDELVTVDQAGIASVTLKPLNAR